MAVDDGRQPVADNKKQQADFGQKHGPQPELNHIVEITGQDIQDYQKQLATEFSNVTANRSLFLIKQVYQHGLLVRALNVDPSSGIRYLSEKGHERNKFLMPAELNRLLEASRQTRGMYYLPALILLGGEHGASKQECLSLKWEDIDFEFEGRGLIRF